MLIGGVNAQIRAPVCEFSSYRYPSLHVFHMTCVLTPLTVSVPMPCHQEQSQSQFSWATAWNPQTQLPLVSLRARMDADQRSGPLTHGLLYGSLLLVLTNAKPRVGPVPSSQGAPQPAPVEPVDAPPVYAAQAGLWFA